MATDDEKFRQHVIEQAVAKIPRGFLEEMNSRLPRAYAEVFSDTKLDPTTLADQKLSRLIQMRCFRIDWELHQAALAHGLAVTTKPLPENSWCYAYVAADSFGLTQSYVSKMGSLPQPAKFRENLASAANRPRLAFDDPEEIYTFKEFYALLAHNPVGRHFDEESQKFGALQFCVPYNDMKGWALEIGVAELLSYYPITKKKSERIVAPIWKSTPKRDTGTK